VIDRQGKMRKNDTKKDALCRRENRFLAVESVKNAFLL
jgi:hypothetical protein